MDTNGKNIWQQAAGDTDRNYAVRCLRWDVILNGPGNTGPWHTNKAKYRAGGMSAKKMTDIGRFADEMQDGDFVILRIGTTFVFGVGQVVGSYEWCEEFGDVDGWDLQHVRRVRWLWYPEPHPQDSELRPKKFPPFAMKLGDTTQKLGGGEVAN